MSSHLGQLPVTVHRFPAVRFMYSTGLEALDNSEHAGRLARSALRK